jgi:hypothetical protein
MSAPFEAKCSALVPHNGVVKVLFTVESIPSSQDEHLLCNLLKSRVNFKQGDIVEITIRKITK